MSDEKKLVTGDSAMKEAVNEVNRLTSGPMIEITSAEQFMALAEAAKATKDSFDVSIKAKMTMGRAQRIKELRVDIGCTWRSVAAHCFEEWGKDADWWPESNQLAGMSLCEFAAEQLGEDALQEPWN